MAVPKNATLGDNCVPRDQYTTVFAPAVKDGHIVTVLKARLLRSRGLARKVLLAAATLLLLTIAAVVVLAVAIATLFRAGRLYAEVMAKWLSRAVLWMWGVRLAVHQDQPFPETQTVYMSNHSSTLDMFVMVGLGLPNTRFVGAEDLGGFLRWMAPLGHHQLRDRDALGAAMVEAGRPGQMVPENRVSPPANRGLGLPQSRGRAGDDGEAGALQPGQFSTRR